MGWGMLHFCGATSLAHHFPVSHANVMLAGRWTISNRYLAWCVPQFYEHAPLAILEKQQYPFKTYSIFSQV